MPKCSPRPRRFLGLAAAGLAGLLCLGGPLRPARPAGAGTPGGVPTFHDDDARTGWNPNEGAMTPASLRGRGLRRLWTAPVEGDIYASPLVVSGVTIRGHARTVVYAVTERDLVYAFDAASGARLWGPVSLGTPVPRADLPCGNIDPVGITSTPVVDRASGTLFTVALVAPAAGRARAYRIAALSLETGARRAGWPVTIDPPASNGIRFDPPPQQQRGALTLLHGVVYVPFGGYWGDCGDYHGWIVAVPVSSPATSARRTGWSRSG